MMIGHMRSMGIKVFRTPYRSALSTCALILLNCYLICEFPRLSLGGNKHAAEHHLCPLRQGVMYLQRTDNTRVRKSGKMAPFHPHVRGLHHRDPPRNPVLQGGEERRWPLR